MVKCWPGPGQKHNLFEVYLDGINKKFVFFHYHLKSRDFTDNAGAIKLGTMQTNHYTSYSCYYFKSQQLDVKRSYLKCILDGINKKFISFQYHLNCRDLTDNAGAIKRGLMQKIKTLYMLVFFTSSLDKLMSNNYRGRNIYLIDVKINPIFSDV